MLGGDHAGHVLDQLADPADRLVLEIAVADGALRSGHGDTDLLQLAAVDDDVLARRPLVLGEGGAGIRQAPASKSGRSIRLPVQIGADPSFD